MIRSLLILFAGMVFFISQAMACIFPVDSKIEDLRGKWIPNSDAKLDRIGPIEIHNDKIRLANGREIVIENPKKRNYTIIVLGKLINKHIITYDISYPTDITGINGSEICNFKAEKIHIWVDNHTNVHDRSFDKNILSIDFTAGPPSFAKLGKDDCGVFSYIKQK